MAPEGKQFRVLIAGAGVTGLTLANMLEKFDIDYLILEAHDKIAPAVGASIGMFPNGLRILDQIDCYEPLRGFMDYSKEVSHTRLKSGKPVVSVPNFQKHVERRHGYPLMFFDRQWLLQSLYDKIKNKERVKLNERVTRVDLAEQGVEIVTASGNKFRGSLIIGADGVHSTVRQEMYRLGNQLEPGYFPEDEQESVPCHYLCNFGIAQYVPGWVPGDQNTVLGNGHSQLVVSGPKDRVYWFFFSKLPDTKYSKEIPKCTKEMEAEFVAKYRDTPITEKVTFGQVYAKRLSSTLTPVHEYVCKKWFFQRMLIFGDSAHKPNPIGGQGGNGAIESAAEFINALLRKKDSRPEGLLGLTDKDITDVFSEMQAARKERAERIIFAAHLQHSLVAYEKPGLSAFVWQFLVPLKGNESSLSLFGLTLARSTRLKKLPLRHRAHVIPYNDELPALPLKRAGLVQMAFSGLMILLFTMALKAPMGSSLQSNLFDGITVPENSAFGGSWLTGATVNPKQSIAVLSRMTRLLSPTLIYTLEGYRLGNRGTFLALPSLYLAAVGFYDIGVVAPIYAVLSAFLSYDLPTGRFVQPYVLHTFLFALTSSYILPMIVLVSGISIPEIWDIEATAKTFAPLLASATTYAISSVVRIWKETTMIEEEKDESELDRYKGQDVPILRFTYGCAFILQAGLHVAMALFSLRYQPFTVDGLVDPNEAFYCTLDSGRVRSKTEAVFSSGYSIAVLVWLLYGLYSVWNLRRLGYIKSRDAIFPSFCFLVGQLLVGPGTAWIGLWYWKESVILGLDKR